jgi:hypothetical protein
LQTPLICLASDEPTKESATRLGSAVLRSSARQKANDPRLRQPQRDVADDLNQADLQQPDLSRPRSDIEMTSDITRTPRRASMTGGPSRGCPAAD